MPVNSKPRIFSAVSTIKYPLGSHRLLTSMRPASPFPSPASGGRLNLPHAVVENLARYAANRLERGNVAAQNRLQILVNDEPRPDQARIAEHHGEQPDDPRHPGLVGELNLEPGEIDLGLLARRSLEPHLERGDGVGPDVAHRALHRGVAASVATLSHFAPQPHRGEARKGDKPFAQIRQEWIGALLPMRPRTIGRRLQTARDIFANGLTVDAELTGYGSNLQALPVEFQDHDKFSEFDHRAPPSRQGGQHR